MIIFIIFLFYTRSGKIFLPHLGNSRMRKRFVCGRGWLRVCLCVSMVVCARLCRHSGDRAERVNAAVDL